MPPKGPLRLARSGFSPPSSTISRSIVQSPPRAVRVGTGPPEYPVQAQQGRHKSRGSSSPRALPKPSQDDKGGSSPPNTKVEGPLPLAPIFWLGVGPVPLAFQIPRRYLSKPTRVSKGGSSPPRISRPSPPRVSQAEGSLPLVHFTNHIRVGPVPPNFPGEGPLPLAHFISA